MNRTKRLAVLAAAVLLLAAAGSAFANRAPAARDVPAQPASSHEPEEEADAPPTVEELARVADRLGVDEAVVADLATRYGLGGAVRLLAWSQETAMDVEVIAAKRDGTDTEPAMGWGQIAHQLGVHPGIGSIMGGGQGRENAPGQQDEPASGE
jgi:membrane-bound lytic murein transglycosylase B